eukprot:gene39586-52207_t
MHQLSTSIGAVKGIKERAGKALKPGVAIVLDNMAYKVTKTIQGKRGKGGGFVRANVKNLATGTWFEKTFTSDEIVEIADLEKIKYTYIYRVNNNFSFMHPKTFEEIQVSKEDIDDWQFLVDGEEMEVKLVFFNGKVIGAELPIKYDYEVTALDENKSSHGQVCAILSSGVAIMVPAFVHVGDRVKINIHERAYSERA